MTGFNLQLIGKDILLRKLEPPNFKKPVSEAIRKITVWYHQTVIVSTPVDTNRLRSSIYAKHEGESGSVFTSNVQYAGFVEYGTHKMKARHVERGSQVRVLGKGMFTYALELLHEKMPDFGKDIIKAIKVRFE